MLLTVENYSKGFLIDEELMAGVSEHPQIPNTYLGFVLRHTTGEYLGYEAYPTLEAALGAIARVKRDWKFETSSGCGSENCGGGQCGSGNCGKTCETLGVCSVTLSESASKNSGSPREDSASPGLINSAGGNPEGARSSGSA